MAFSQNVLDVSFINKSMQCFFAVLSMCRFGSIIFHLDFSVSWIEELQPIYENSLLEIDLMWLYSRFVSNLV